MYTLNLSAVGVSNGIDKRWAAVDLTSASVKDLMAAYRLLQIELIPTATNVPVYLVLSDISVQYSNFTGTMQALLNAHNGTLPTRAVPFKLASDIARFYDALKQRYSVVAVDADNIQPPLADSIVTDHIRIDRPDTVLYPAKAVNEVLVSINGFYHRADNIGNRGLFVRNGYKSIRRAKQTQIGLWDFKELGGFTILPEISGEMDDSDTAYQVLLEGNVANKTVFFVIAGYFFPVDGTVVTQNGVGMYLIDFAHAAMRLTHRYFEAANYIDLSTVAAAAAGVTPGTINPALLGSPAAMQAWLELNQSFTVIVNRKETHLQQRFLKRSSSNPDQYSCYLDRDPRDQANAASGPRLSLSAPNLPLSLELGRHPSYEQASAHWQHLFRIYDNRVGQLMHAATPPAEQLLTSGVQQPGSPGLVQHAYLLEFGSNAKD